MGSEQQSTSFPQVGRNDPCPCGSGKKYKKCCMAKHQAEERVRQQKATHKLTDRWFPGREFVQVVGYPLLKIHLFLLEVVNLIGDVVNSRTGWDEGQVRSVLDSVLEAGLTFYRDGCRKCEHNCLASPSHKISFQSLLDRGFELADYPEALQKPIALNLFYLEFVGVLMARLDQELCQRLPEDQGDDVFTSVHSSLIYFIARNCGERCNNECLLEYGASGYCGICMFSSANLPCPKKHEISYLDIKAFPDDMVH